MESEATSSDENTSDTTLTVEYDKRDKYGNVEYTTAKDEFGSIRETTMAFDDEGVFAVKEINALGHETKFEYDSRFGVLTKVTDPNGLVTDWLFDSLGREILEKRPDGSGTSTTLSRIDVNGAQRLSMRITTTGGADDEVIVDNLARPIETFSYGPTVGGKITRLKQVTEYDPISGQVARKSVPIAETTPAAQVAFDEYTYDALRRLIRHTTPWNAILTNSYDGLTTDSTDAKQHHTITHADPLGRPLVITDAANAKTTYSYGPFKRLRSVTDPGGATTLLATCSRQRTPWGA